MISGSRNYCEIEYEPLSINFPMIIMHQINPITPYIEFYTINVLMYQSVVTLSVWRTPYFFVPRDINSKISSLLQQYTMSHFDLKYAHYTINKIL